MKSLYLGDGSNGGWLFRKGSESKAGKSLHVSIDDGQALRFSFTNDHLDLADGVSDETRRFILYRCSLTHKYTFFSAAFDSGESGNSAICTCGIPSYMSSLTS